MKLFTVFVKQIVWNFLERPKSLIFLPLQVLGDFLETLGDFKETLGDFLQTLGDFLQTLGDFLVKPSGHRGKIRYFPYSGCQHFRRGRSVLRNDRPHHPRGHHRGDHPAGDHRRDGEVPSRMASPD